jgi:hypothetical protein
MCTAPTARQEELKMRSTRRTARTVPARTGSFSLPERLETRRMLAAVVDDFNDGNDTGWTHYEPLAAFGSGGTYQVVNGQYRLASLTPSPDPGALGPGRVGSIRNDANYTDFVASIDLIDWDTGLNQAFGLLARVTTPGLGTTNGYALSYATNGDLDITLLTGELTDDLDQGVDVSLDPAKDYRLVFEGHGPNLTGKLFDLENLATPIAVTHASDRTWTSGTTGVFVYDNTRTASATADATFDNFSANDAPPADPTVAYWRFEEGQADQEFQPPSFDNGPDSGLAIDSAGNDDALRTFSSNTNPTYVADVPAATVTVTGASNTLSLDFIPNEDLYTARQGAINPYMFDRFTVEASFNADTITWMNIVGKDGKPLQDVAISPLQLKVRDDTDKLQIEIIDHSGQEKQVQSIDPIVAGHWYHAAAVSDGTTLSLYLDDTTLPGGYVLQGSVPVSGGLYDSNGTWTVGRGYFNGNNTDWFDGRIDEVRISGAALDPSQFLFAQASAPRVTNVYVSGSSWGTPFKDFLAAQGIGSAQYGYQILATDQLNELPWTNLDRISIAFDQNVNVDQADLAVRGVNLANYTISGFDYQPSTKTATWTLSQPIRNDKVLLDLNADAGGVSSPQGGALDGEWNNAGDTFPSGNGTAGGDFRFRFNVLPGDVTRNGTVVADDFSDVKARFFRTVTQPGPAGPTQYDVFRDVDGTGSILANDFSLVKARFFNTLPGGEPTAPAASFNDDRIAAAVLA